MSCPKVVPLREVVTGDAWDGIASIEILVNGAPPSAAAASAFLTFRLGSVDGAQGLALSSDGGGISIDDAAGWQFSVPPAIISMAAGEWHGDFRVVDDNGDPHTYLRFVLPVAATSNPPDA